MAIVFLLRYILSSCCEGVSVCDYLPASSALYRFVSAPLSLCLFDGRRAFLVASRTVMHETFLVLWRSQIILIK